MPTLELAVDHNPSSEKMGIQVNTLTFSQLRNASYVSAGGRCKLLPAGGSQPGRRITRARIRTKEPYAARLIANSATKLD